PERLASWLTHIAVHEAKARLRRRGRIVDVKEGPLHAVPSPSSDPEQEALGKQLQRVLVSAIDALPVGYRTVFVLRDVEGMSTAEVSESLGVSEQAVKMRLHRARGVLRQVLYDRAGSPSTWETSSARRRPESTSRASAFATARPRRVRPGSSAGRKVSRFCSPRPSQAASSPPTSTTCAPAARWGRAPSPSAPREGQ